MTTSPPLPSRLRTWLQLVRAPNLFTVPGDPLAGFLLANNGFLDWTLGLAIAASLCFYAAGLLMNDLADEAEDRRERPNRPLPSGAASRGSVFIAMLVLCALGLVALALTQRPPAVAAGVAVITAITLYNFLTKRWPVIGALNMGLCRSLSVMLGVLVVPITISKMAIVPAVFLGLYIAAVTNLARHETHDRVPVLARLLPSLIILLVSFGGIVNAFYAPATEPAAALFLLASLCVLWIGIKLFKKPAPPLPPLIGAHIRILLPLQAAFCLSGNSYPRDPGQISALLLLAVWPLSKVVSKRFYAS